MSEQQNFAVQSAPDSRKKQGSSKKGTFQPGVSGNPGGRPGALMHIRELARAQTEPALAKIVRLMEEAESQSVQLDAAKELLNRAWGRPEQFIDLGVTVEHKSALVDKLLALLSGDGTKTIEHAPDATATASVTDDTTAKG